MTKLVDWINPSLLIEEAVFHYNPSIHAKKYVLDGVCKDILYKDIRSVIVEFLEIKDLRPITYEIPENDLEEYLKLFPKNFDFCWRLFGEVKEPYINKPAPFKVPDNLDNADWELMSSDCNDMNLLLANFDRVDMGWLSANPAAIPWLLKNPDKICWPYVTSNPRQVDLYTLFPSDFKIEPKALIYSFNTIQRLLENHFEYKMHVDPANVEFFKHRQNKINWFWFSANPGIFL